MARRRSLRPDEEEIWELVARTARAMHPARPKQPDVEPAAQKPPPKPAKPPAGLPEFRIGNRAPQLPARHDLSPTIAQQLATSPLRMDAGVHKAMRRGKLMPEARLDLHGLTLAEAHPELIHFVLNAHAAGMRLVLVITGKGKDRDNGGPIPTRTGALRHQLPHWLRLPPLGPVVLQIAEAHLKHGGAGAFYVYLRRHR
ncbi:DNA-nicking endonuclease, Smr domain [Gemmobacter megaterium]|uniref:DNA-nicking endonuclease, Smr domain n=1 Tax=Gemmobacter megaterium TaxID=1086013 RepID=A0A1N7PQJ1_9RHOB|nr:Smr/MutS family protein [Gemmobacter megaterium]GGE20678.1 DNA mismatch repair protein MutS [Gemmobacter megaterium]SIT12904.1 DNA-nicking endonuclease, Smr domain [Gemmobacter megaterium]